MKQFFNPAPALILLTLFPFLILKPSWARAQFSAGNLVVLQAGDGTSALVNTGNKIVLKEFSPLGAATFSLVVPFTSNPLLIGGSASSEGGLSLSPNGKFLLFGGYAQALPNTIALSGSTASTIKRAIGVVDAAGSYTRVSTVNNFFSGNNIRSAASDGANNFWAAGSNNGTNYFGLNSPTVTVQNSATNTRYISVVNNSLYVSCGSGSFGVYRVGSALPFSAGQTTSLVINTANTGAGSASPYAFYFNPAQTVCYVADDRNGANGGGLQKWVYSAGTWTLAYTLGTGANYGARGVVADFSGPNPRVYATTSEGSSNRLIVINDAGALSTPTTLATSGSNALFRGLAFAPYCSDPLITAINSNSPVCAAQSLTLNASIAGPGPFTYTWSGPGSFSSALAAPVLPNPAGGSYSLDIANGCGNSALSASITVHTLPPVSASSATICSGGTATLSAGGAASYTWSSGSTNAAISVTPAGTSSFTLSGSSPEGCVTTVTTAVQVVSSLTLSAASATVCEGSAATLSVSGAGSYTWSTGNNGPTLTTTPAATGIYSVTGSASGCAAAATTTAMITVHTLPLVSVNSASICAGAAAVLSASGAATYSWNANLNTPSISVSPTVTSTYTVTGMSTQACPGTATALVMVMALPEVSLTFDHLAVCINSPAMLLTGTPVGGAYAGPGVNGSQFDPSLVQPGTVTFSYQYTDAAGCSNTSIKTLIVSACTGLEDKKENAFIVIYPNPAKEIVYLVLDHTQGAGNLELLDSSGQRLWSQPAATGQVAIDLRNYPQGLYFLKLEHQGHISFNKILKE